MFNLFQINLVIYIFSFKNISKLLDSFSFTINYDLEFINPISSLSRIAINFLKNMFKHIFLSTLRTNVKRALTVAEGMSSCFRKHFPSFSK